MGKKAKSEKLFVQQGDWATGLANMPVFIDGLTHKLFYLIVACKNSSDKYQAVVLGKFGPNQFKVKFYGNFEEWGFTEGSLREKFNANDFLYHGESIGYARYWTDRRGVDAILDALDHTRGVTVCPVSGVYQAFDIPAKIRAEVSLACHPLRGGHRPALPFFPKPLLEHNSTGAACA
jgi:hypothetical protein